MNLVEIGHIVVLARCRKFLDCQHEFEAGAMFQTQWLAVWRIHPLLLLRNKHVQDNLARLNCASYMLRRIYKGHGLLLFLH
jgi:hypothetical protein